MAENGSTEVKDLGYKKLIRDLGDVKGSHVDVGIFGGKAPGGKSILVYALANEFGTATIPERPFMRSTVDENRGRYLGMIDTGLTKISLGQESAKAVLTRLGITIRQEIQRKIRDLRDPPNAPSTLAGSKHPGTNPLINTGTMRKAIEYKLGKVFDSKTNSIIRGLDK